MGILDVYYGRQTWADFISSQPRGGPSETALPEDLAILQVGGDSIGVRLNSKDYETALEAGLGAVGMPAAQSSADKDHSIELAVDKLAGGLDRLNADFNILLGDIIWKQEMNQHALNDILQEIRLAEFEREARAYRNRAERAYLNGWYEEALADFLEAEKRNYPDYSVHRSIGNIYLYHSINLAKASEYFLKAAKYARPADARQCAEAYYFAGIVHAIEQRRPQALAAMSEAVRLNPELYEAHYQGAGLAAMLGDYERALASLEPAIKGDPRYYERARCDAVFDPMRREVQSLLDNLMEPVKAKVAQVKRDAKLIEGYVIAEPVEQRISTIIQTIEQQMAAAKTYKAGLGLIEAFSEVQEELKSIYDLFYKQYEMDPHDYVRSIAFSPDARLLASGFLNGGIRLWEVDSGLNTQLLTGHVASVNSVAFSPDSQWVASGSRDKTIKLWDAETGHELQTLRAHEAEVSAVTFSPDGQWLVSGSYDRTVRRWRVVTGQQAETLGSHTNRVTAAVFSPDGRLVASASIDKSIKLWDVATGRAVRTMIGHARGVASLAFSADGRLIASGGEDSLVKVWDVATGRQVQTLRGHYNSVTSVAFSPDGAMLAAGSLGQTILVWKRSTATLIKSVRFKDISYNSVAFSPKGGWLALGSRDLQLWLKVVLSAEEYSAVKAGQERAQRVRSEEDEKKLLAINRFIDSDLIAEPRPYGICMICAKKLSFIERRVFRYRCKRHR